MQHDVSELVLEEITRWLRQQPLVSPLREACEFMLLPGGKLIRPRLAASLCRDLGGAVAPLARPLAALELLHVSSLVHDDLPALDNDDFRRGRPSCHRRFSESTAILCGDTLLAGAFSLVAHSSLPAEALVLLLGRLSDAYTRLGSGQQLDITGVVSGDELLKLHQLKTGSLFSASAFVGCAHWAHDDYLADHVEELGLWFGVGFQIVDDLIDGLEAKGREALSDAEKSKATFLTLHREELFSAVEITKGRINECLEAVEGLSEKKLLSSRSLIDMLFAQLADHGVDEKSCGNF